MGELLNTIMDRPRVRRAIQIELKEVLFLTRGDVRRAAQAFGWSRQTFYVYCERFGVDPRNYRLRS